MNVAVWYNFDNNTPLTTGAQFWLAQAQQEANNGFPGVNFHRVAAYTPLNQYDPDLNSPQEIITIVPEPTSLVLFGSGLVGLLARKRTS